YAKTMDLKFRPSIVHFESVRVSVSTKRSSGLGVGAVAKRAVNLTMAPDVRTHVVFSRSPARSSLQQPCASSLRNPQSHGL
ncbi:MAG: hypothetical protein NZ743_10820, partial [Pseudomonadales bacterium]|nr:hypothetical protein [Pseudomonadales bacterium]